ncbi:ribosome biogenesis GTPase Der [bacterium]|nr:ribosome biogenesis GTPase Der [bacterium]
MERRQSFYPPLFGAGAMKNIVLVGRPNVGKSSLFNALLGFRRTIVLDLPGTTMDLVRERVSWGPLTLVDSQGMLDDGDSEVLQGVLELGDAFLFVVDGQVGLTPFDQWLAKELLKSKKPTLVLVNKTDQPSALENYREFYELGFPQVAEVSAVHKRGFDGLKEWCLSQLESTTMEEEAEPIQLALVGRPNSGKSTLMNKLCRMRVSRVSPVPHTTRDTVGFEIESHGRRIKILDTAGIRRPRSKKESLEQFSIQASTRAIKDADVVFLLINCSEAITDQDMRLLSLLERQKKPTVVLLNFWDLLTGEQRRKFIGESDFARYLRRFKTQPISGKTGWNIHKLLSWVVRLNDQANKRIKTSDLNRFVKEVISRNPPPAAGSGNFNIMYASQVKTSPPTFIFFMNRKGNLPESYQRYLENQIKSRLGFQSQPIRIHFRAE